MRLLLVSGRRAAWTYTLALPLLFVALGCGKGEATVTGEVQLDGKPIENGTITFEPADKNGPTMGGPIVGGRYEVKGVPGKKVVLVTSFQPTGKKIPAGPPDPPGTMVDEILVFPPTGKSHEVKEFELKPGPNEFSVRLTSTPTNPPTPSGGPK